LSRLIYSSCNSNPFWTHANSFGGVCGLILLLEVQDVSLFATFADCSGGLLAGDWGAGTIGFIFFTKGAFWRLCRFWSWVE
jgi:hypothetical protein